MSSFRNLIKIVKNSEYFLLALVMLLAVLVRLYKVDSPIADWHSWRQADTASVTRIYLDKGFRLLYPRYYDISSIQTGIYNPNGYRFVEFPIFNLFHFLLVKTFPFISIELAGRMLSIIASLFSVFFIFYIGKKFVMTTDLKSFWGGILSAFFFALLPYNVFFSRVILPEPLSLTFALASIVFFIKFSENAKTFPLIASSLFFALALLVKPFTLFYIIVFVALAAGHKHGAKNLIKDVRVIVALALSLTPFFVWRIWINQFPQGIPHWSWAFNGDRIRFRPAFWRWIFGERVGKLILGIWGLVPAVLGFLKTSSFNLLFLSGVILYVVVLATANVRHDYYQIYLIPPLSLFLAQGTINMWFIKDFSRILARSVLIFSIVMMFLVGISQVKEYYKINHPEIIEAGVALDGIAPKDALVIAPYNGDTAFLYQTKRFGWPVVETSVDDLRDKGADYYVSVNLGDPDSKDVIKRYKVLLETDRYFIADLGKPLNK